MLSEISTASLHILYKLLLVNVQSFRHDVGSCYSIVKQMNNQSILTFFETQLNGNGQYYIMILVTILL
jgi:hypothetical protein